MPKIYLRPGVPRSHKTEQDQKRPLSQGPAGKHPKAGLRLEGLAPAPLLNRISLKS